MVDSLDPLLPVTGADFGIWGDKYNEALRRVNADLEAAQADIVARATIGYVDSRAEAARVAAVNEAIVQAELDAALATLSAALRADLEPKIGRTGATTGYIVSLAADGKLVLTAPGGNTAPPDATATTKGLLRLTGDLGGTAEAPTTPTAVHRTGDESVAGLKRFTTGLEVPVGTLDPRALATTGTRDATTVLHGDGAYRAPSGGGTGSATLGVRRRTASHALTLDDAGTMQVVDLAADGTLTIPADESVNFPVGTQVLFLQRGAGRVRVAAASTTGLVSVSDAHTYVGNNALLTHPITLPGTIPAGAGLLMLMGMASTARTLTGMAGLTEYDAQIGPSGASMRVFVRHDVPAGLGGTTVDVTLNVGTPIVCSTVVLSGAHATAMVDGSAPLSTDADAADSDSSADPYTTVGANVLELSLRAISTGTTVAAPPTPPAEVTLLTNGATNRADANTATGIARGAGPVAAGTVIGNRQWSSGYGSSRTIGVKPRASTAVTIVSAGNAFTTSGQGADGVLTKIGPNEWHVGGFLVA